MPRAKNYFDPVTHHSCYALCFVIFYHFCQSADFAKISGYEPIGRGHMAEHFWWLKVDILSYYHPKFEQKKKYKVMKF